MNPSCLRYHQYTLTARVLVEFSILKSVYTQSGGRLASNKIVLQSTIRVILTRQASDDACRAEYVFVHRMLLSPI